MGLFNRNSQNENQDDFDEIDLPSSNDLKGNLFAEEEPKFDAPVTSAPKRTVSRGSYGIEEAIRLMKDLPRDNNEVVVTVVKRTLESTNIQVDDIIEDANAKEERIRQHHKKLEEEIKSLQDQIAQRNQQITDLLRDLKETTDVRQRLQLAMELEAKLNPPKAEPAKVEASPSSEPASNGDAQMEQRPNLQNGNGHNAGASPNMQQRRPNVRPPN